MSTDNHAIPSSPSPEIPASSPKSKPPAAKAGEYLFKQETIPVETKAFIQNRLGVDQDGNPRVKEGGEVININIFPAKEGGTYKGTVILNNETWLVQSVGNGNSAVVHKKQDIELQGSGLKKRDEDKSLHNADIQIFYTKDKAKAYPWNKEKAQEKADGKQTDPASKVDSNKIAAITKKNTQEIFAQVSQYAQDNIKNTNQRNAFLKHVSAATGIEIQQHQDSKTPESSEKKNENPAPVLDTQR